MPAIMFGCVICEMAFEEGEEDCVAAACGHVFHEACLQGSCMAFPICLTCNCLLTDPPKVTPIILNNLDDGLGDTLSDLHDDLQRMQQEKEIMLTDQKELKEKNESLEKKLAEKEKIIGEKEKEIKAMHELSLCQNHQNGDQNNNNESLAKQLTEQKQKNKRIWAQKKQLENKTEQKIKLLEERLSDAMEQLSFRSVNGSLLYQGPISDQMLRKLLMSMNRAHVSYIQRFLKTYRHIITNTML